MAESSRSEPRAERGVQYPAENLQTAVEMLGRVREAIGFSAASRESIAEALGHKGITGSSARKIGVLTHFDLLERVGSGAYRISDLGKSILIPTSSDEYDAAIAEAAKRPNLYWALIDRYKDHALPSMLANLLTREHGVFAGSAEAAAKTFRESMEFSRLLRNGILYDEPPASRAADAIDPSEGETETPDGQRTPTHAGATGGGPPQVGANVQRYTIALDGQGRIASIHIPIPLSARDLKKIAAWISYMTVAIEEEQETPDISAN